MRGGVDWEWVEALLGLEDESNMEHMYKMGFSVSISHSISVRLGSGKIATRRVRWGMLGNRCRYPVDDRFCQRRRRLHNILK